MIKASRGEIVVFFLFLGSCLLYLRYLTLHSLQSSASSTGRVIGLGRLVAQATCGRFPLLSELNVSDTNWQVTNTSNGTFYLLNAYYDDRAGLPNGSAVIRLLALVNRVDPVVRTHCQLWFEDGGGGGGLRQAETSEVHEYRMLWPKYWGVNDKGAPPYLISCPLPPGRVGAVPQFVSLSEERCGAANNVLEVRNKRPPADGRRRHFLVSVKGIDFEDDVSLQLVEWCEILKILGVDHVEVFVVRAHDNVKRTLAFYRAQGFVTLKFITFPRELPNKLAQSWIQWTQNDLVPYHDSFYENLRLYEYMVPMDIDEFVVPVRTEDRSWQALMQRTIERSRARKEDFDAFPVTNRYFLLKSVHENETIEGIPKHLRFLSNIYRAANSTPNGGNMKSFMRMDRIFAVHNHFPFSCIGPENCRLFDVNLTDGHLGHYRTDCDTPECKESKADPARDTTLWKWKNEIIEAVNDTLAKLNMTLE